ncbi:MAG: hypothetical protein DME98_14610 [Verrucomicrobia bacterium]|nr:MAG: hypothetical protein DME98_14610 [Verrucomicrobiota bacterium]PYJ32085.1 MAG: hypothetical protein DME88_12150 [Verrucomicrobiota bacterium]
MLPFQVGAIDPNRPTNKDITSWKRAVRAWHAVSRHVDRKWLKRPSLRRVLSVWLLLISLFVFTLAPPVLGQSKGRKKRTGATASPSASPGEQSLTNIPLPIGHEAKGLVLPDFDANGHLRGRIEAGTAHRMDEEHIGFQNLKITTYTPDNQSDLRIDMNTSVLDLKTRILSSQERTTIQRADFNIVGDSVQFDTNSRTARLIGNVKMVITDKSHLTAKPNASE